jgi:hypothetical protein
MDENSKDKEERKDKASGDIREKACPVSFSFRISHSPRILLSKNFRIISVAGILKKAGVLGALFRMLSVCVRLSLS